MDLRIDPSFNEDVVGHDSTLADLRAFSDVDGAATFEKDVAFEGALEPIRCGGVARRKRAC